MKIIIDTDAPEMIFDINYSDDELDNPGIVFNELTDIINTLILGFSCEFSETKEDAAETADEIIEECAETIRDYFESSEYERMIGKMSKYDSMSESSEDEDWDSLQDPSNILSDMEEIFAAKLRELHLTEEEFLAAHAGHADFSLGYSVSQKSVSLFVKAGGKRCETLDRIQISTIIKYPDELEMRCILSEIFVGMAYNKLMGREGFPDEAIAQNTAEKIKRAIAEKF